MLDEAKLNQFMGQMLADLGGAGSIAMVRMGDSLGLYKTLHAKGPMTVEELAAAAGVNQRYPSRVGIASGGLEISHLRCNDAEILPD